MTSYQLKTDITLDKVYRAGDIITSETLGSYLEYYLSINVLELIPAPEPTKNSK